MHTQNYNSEAARRKRRRLRRERLRKQRMQRVTFVSLLAVLLTVVGLRIFAVDDKSASPEPLPIPVYEEPQTHTELMAVVETTPEKSIQPTTTPKAEPEPEPDYLLEDIALSQELQTVAYEAAETYDVPYSMLLAVMFKESSYNIEATNGTCWGLMQIHEVNHEWLEELLGDDGVTDIQSDPTSNIRAGAYLLGSLYDKYGDWDLSLMAYNCGEGGASNLWSQGCYSTQYSRGCIELAESIESNITKR